MVYDIYGGVTNNKIGDGHDDENYWYKKDGNSYKATYNQLAEAWAEFFSAQLCMEKRNINANKTWFPEATKELNNLADEMLRYYKNKHGLT